MKPTIGVIGGSGLYDMEGIEGVERVDLDTPFGKPSDSFITGTLEGKRVAFLSRHGAGHRLLPTEINFRANLWGMKKLGVEWILSASAVGSMREEIRPGIIVFPHQFIDRTSKRISTFFGKGIVAHAIFADPICLDLAGLLDRAARSNGIEARSGGTYICIEGPQFSTRAESELYRSWGADVIGMTNVTEARLAREAEMCYATMALATDYDCWHEAEEDVTVEAILEIMAKNVTTARRLVKETVKLVELPRECSCSNAMQGSILSAKEIIPEETRRALQPIIGKYL